MGGYVYMIDVMEYSKIGVSVNPAKRLATIQAHCPYRATLYATKWCDDPLYDENKWHKKFLHRRIRGEWFLLNHQEKLTFVKWGAQLVDDNGCTLDPAVQAEVLMRDAAYTTGSARIATEEAVEVKRLESIEKVAEAASHVRDNFMKASGFRQRDDGVWVKRRRRSSQQT